MIWFYLLIAWMAVNALIAWVMYRKPLKRRPF